MDAIGLEGSGRRRLVRGRAIVAGAVLALLGSAAAAGVTVDIGVGTLNELLPALSAQTVEVPLSESQSIHVRVNQMRITGLDPAANDGAGAILTELQLEVPELGLRLPAVPSLSLHVARAEGGSLLELHFDRVPLRLPLAGALDVARFLPPLRFPADNLWAMQGAAGLVEVESRLVGVRMGRESIRFEFEVGMREAPRP